MSGNHSDTIWTPEVMEFFLALSKAPENFTYSEIAKRLSKKFGREIGRNACIGKAYRMRLPAREPHYLPPPAKPKPCPVDPAGIPIEHLERGDCRFAYGKFEARPPYQFCGRPVVQEGGSWCKDHYHKVFSRRHE